MSSPRKTRWFQFSLCTVLVLTAMAVCFLGGWKARDEYESLPAYFSGSTHVKRVGIKIETIALDLNLNKNLCELGVGRDDGVEIDTVFTVSRGQMRVAEVIVKKTSPDLCVGVIKPLDRAWTPYILGRSRPVHLRKGDYAAAILPVVEYRPSLGGCSHEDDLRRLLREIVAVRTAAENAKQ